MTCLCRCLTEEDLETAEEKIRTFLRLFKEVFSEDDLVPNMHMMLHIPDDIRRFGPSPSNW